MARAKVELADEIRQYELRHAVAMRKIGTAGRLEVTSDDLARFEHVEEVSVSTLRDYLDSIGARLELVAWFDEPDRRVPIELI